MKYDTSAMLFQQSCQVTPGGVHNPARSFRSVGGGPALFMRRGAGAYLWDEDNNQYCDYVLSWGPLILGHADPTVVEALQECITTGVHFGTPTKSEYELSRFLVEHFPTIDQVRLVNSGSEAVMAAIGTAKVFTGRRAILKFIGCYHGWSDEMMVGSPYRPMAHDRAVYLAPFNDLDRTRTIVAAHSEELAAVIVEPVAGNMGVIAPAPGFLEGLRTLCTENDIILIFDEVMTGFRVAYGGAQHRYGVVPDMTCLGKIIGGGLPIGAYGGREDIMKVVAPFGAMYQGGTYSGHRLSATAGLATLQLLAQDTGYPSRLEAYIRTMCDGIVSAAQHAGVPVHAEVVGGMFTVYFCNQKPSSYEAVQTCDVNQFTRFFRGMLEAGVYWPPSQFESVHVSLAHSPTDFDNVITAAESIFASW